MIGNATDAWWLGERQGTSVGEVAYEVFGEGSPVVLVHGTPTRSYLWRNIVPALAEHRRVYVYDLLGYGESEKGEGQDVSIAAQARVLKELVEAWGLEEPAIAGHDIGGGIVLRAQLLEGVRFSRVAILDAGVLGPWLSAPRWLEEGRRAFVRQALQFEEQHTEEIEPRLASVEVPLLVVWGEKDGWLDPSLALRLRKEIPGSELKLIQEGGHFVQEDAPEEIAKALAGFFSGDGERA